MPARVRAVLAALGPLAVAVIVVLTVFQLVDWSKAQTALVTAEAGAIIGLVIAVVAHFWPTTKKEPVALAATFTAALSATIALGTGFGWWDLTKDENSALVGLVSAIFGIGGALLAREKVTSATTPAA